MSSFPLTCRSQWEGSWESRILTRAGSVSFRALARSPCWGKGGLPQFSTPTISREWPLSDSVPVLIQQKIKSTGPDLFFHRFQVGSFFFLGFPWVIDSIIMVPQHGKFTQGSFQAVQDFHKGFRFLSEVMHQIPCEQDQVRFQLVHLRHHLADKSRPVIKTSQMYIGELRQSLRPWKDAGRAGSTMLSLCTFTWVRPLAMPQAKPRNTSNPRRAPGIRNQDLKSPCFSPEQGSPSHGEIPEQLAQVEQELGYIEHEEDAHDQHHPEKAGRIPQLLKLQFRPTGLPQTSAK
jgi:hypothetical protein